MTSIESRLRRAGYRLVHNHNPGMWVKLWREGSWIYGKAAFVWNGGFVWTAGAAIHTNEATFQAMQIVAGDMELDLEHYVAGRRRRKGGLRAALKRMSTKFRARVNKIAKKIAKGKIMNKLRGAYVKVLESPIAGGLFQAAAQGLQAVGVPAPLARMIIEHKRRTKISRLKGGGWAGSIARATEAGKRRGGLFREEAKRHAEALPGSLMAAIPGGNLTKYLGKLAKKRGGKLSPRLQRVFSKMNIKIPGVSGEAIAGIPYEDIVDPLPLAEVNGYTRRSDYNGGYNLAGYGV
jgi:hypothetical protein